MKRIAVLLSIALLGCTTALAQVFRPPPFVSGIPGRAQMQAVEIQGHQRRTLLYREAIEELRRNSAVAEIRDCVDVDDHQTLCLPQMAPAAVSPAIAARPTARRLAVLIGNRNYRYPSRPWLLRPGMSNKWPACCGISLDSRCAPSWTRASPNWYAPWLNWRARRRSRTAF